MVDVSLALAQMVGQESEQGLAAVEEDRLLLKTQLCRKIADLLEVLAPGISKLTLLLTEFFLFCYKAFCTICFCAGQDVDATVNTISLFEKDHRM